jgi:hypothetical protein
MNDRWEEEKEKLISLRVEYAALFTHHHFFQGLRFAVLAATLPILGTLFNYYRIEIPFSQFKLLIAGEIAKTEPVPAVMIAAVGLGVFFAVRSIEHGIGLQTRAIVDRGTAIELQLGIVSGAFSALRQRVNLPTSHRITGIIRWGYRIGIGVSSFLFVLGLWTAFK